MSPEQKLVWLQEFRLNGFVVLRDFLPVDLVDGMYRDLLPLLDSEHDKEVASGWKRGRGRARLALDVKAYGDLMKGPLADGRYRENPVIEELVDEILGRGRWKRGWTQVEVAWKGSEHMGWHSDQSPDDSPDPDEPNRTRRVTFNIPLVEFTWANGATEFIPGSHHLPRSFQEAGDIRRIPNVHAVRPELRRGDAILRDGHTLHRGTPNLTDSPRPMLDQTYKLSTDKGR